MTLNRQEYRSGVRSAAASRYVVEGQLAEGGMGVVYRVFDRVTGEVRALKRLIVEGGVSSIMVEAFEREYQVLAGLDHPRIIRVFDYGVDELGPYYTMEMLEGRDLRQAAPLPYWEACHYLRDVATSLALLHARRLIHRDLSPRNVRLTSDGHCKLLDFGALEAFGYTRVLIGTPPFVPPEAVEGLPLDQRADLYALGALAYWTLTGRHAFPARQIAELRAMWEVAPVPPSTLMPETPRELDTLVLSLLSRDPRARPDSAAEVIAKLNVVGKLPPESSKDVERLALSFLSSPRFTGRGVELETLTHSIDEARRGSGGSVWIEAVAGMGRSRFLEELGVRAQLAGATVIRADASMYRQKNGTTRALVACVFDALPNLAADHAGQFRAALTALGNEIVGRLGRQSRPSLPGTQTPVAQAPSLEGWFGAISREKPLLVAVDNAEDADDQSLGLLVGLARMASTHPILLVVSHRLGRQRDQAIGLVTLREHSKRFELSGLSADETRLLVRSLFGETPNVGRFAEWLHGKTAGSPLHIIEITRQLLEKQVIRYSGGIWTLPDQRPDAELPSALEEVLFTRIGALSERARILAECLSLQQEQPTLELCRVLAPESESDEHNVLALLDELAQSHVLYAERDGYRFSSTAIREALLGGMDDMRLEQNHRRLGEAFAGLAGETTPALRIEAGFHLIQGGDETRGADMIAEVAQDAVTVRMLIVDLHHVGRPLEAALNVYGRQRRSTYERIPLLAGLAQAGYYEDRAWGERFGDAALDVLEDISGLRMARRLRPYCGRTLSLIFGVFFAFLRFQFVPRAERKYSFKDVLVQLFASVTCLSGTAALSFDVTRADRVANVLEPFSVLPERLTPVGIYQFCRALQEIGRENEAMAYETADELVKRFENPRYYPTFPADARKLYVAACHFVRGSFAVFRADGRGALESADALDQSGLKLYAMIASQLRFLYYMNRGEFAAAATHREQVELHAAHVGSVWQVETWEAPALILVYGTLSDVVASTRVAHRLERLSRTVPSLKLHSRLAKQAVVLTRKETNYTEMVAADYRSHVPRSYIGWAATMGFLARGYNELGRYDEAKGVCERALSHVNDADRQYVSHFLGLDVQHAVADAGLGNTEAALARLEVLQELFKDCEHPLLHGLLHETRARIAWNARRVAEYERSLAEMEKCFLPTGTPALVAKCEQLAQLRAANSKDARSEPLATQGVPSLESDTVLDGSMNRTETIYEPRPSRTPSPGTA